jgi:hypothetical protein
VLTLGTAIDTETERQEAPLHSMWWEIRRCFRSWARASGHGDRVAAADGRRKSAFHEFLQSSPGPLAQEVLGPGGLGTTVDEFVAALEQKLPPAPDDQLAAFEADLGGRLPEDYRRFLIACNGGWNGMGYHFRAPTPEGRFGSFWLQYLGGFREFERQSLTAARRRYQGEPLRIPRSLVWIATNGWDDAICLGIAGPPRGGCIISGATRPSLTRGRWRCRSNPRVTSRCWPTRSPSSWPPSSCRFTRPSL